MESIWIIGTGNMGIEYAKVLNALDIKYIAIGRGNDTAEKFENATNHVAIRGGINKFLLTSPKAPTHAIIAVNVELLASTAMALIQYGVKNILLEKPGVYCYEEIIPLVKIAHLYKTNVLLAYNRRFYTSVLKAEEIIKLDNGVSSFNFEFTEWSHLINPKPEEFKEYSRWFLANSSHVADLAFYLGGKPRIISSFHKGGLSWHPTASVFCGAGITEKDALFSYQANWEAPGRWSIEINTKRHRLYFRPMEKLQIQQLGKLDISYVELDDSLDIKFKPGLFLQTQAFLNNKFNRFCTLDEQEILIEKYYEKIAGYDI